MDSAISNTAEQAAARDQDLVQRLTGYSSGYYGGVARNTGSMGTGGSGGPRFEPSARGGPQTPAGLYGATGEASSGPGGFAGDPSLQGQAGLLASFDGSAAARYRAAADTTRNRAQTFNKPADRRIVCTIAALGTDDLSHAGARLRYGRLQPNLLLC